ncbi:MAG: hypothetical protein ACE5GW_06190, partial [Planctomycetota bacterium]
MSGRRERGSMLIVALMVLTLLSILAVTFAALMRLERRATENFANSARVEMIASSATSNVIAMLRGGTFWDGYTTHNELKSPWLYGIKSRRGELRLGGVMPLEEARPEDTSYHGMVGSTYARGEDRFRVKIIDTSSQISLNGRQDTLADMLEHLGLALDGDEEIRKNPFYTGPNETGRKVTGREIPEFRNKLEGGRFHSKAQLREIIGEDNYRIVADFVTAHAWEDPSTYSSQDGFERFKNPFNQAGQTNVNAGPGLKLEIVGPARVTPEPRCPININTAAEPVLIAALMGIGGRRAYPYVDISRQRVEEANRGAIDVGGGTLPPAQEELSLNQLPVWIYTRPLTFDNAKQIARAIIAKRKQVPFSVWKSGSAGGRNQGFEEFVNQLPDSFFPDPSTIAVVNPDDPLNRRYKSDILNPQHAANILWAKGHPATESFRRQKGMPHSRQNAWYYETIRGVLNANFNPNSRLNKYNPNAPAYAAVDKSNLVKLGEAGTDPTKPLRGHTTEFCFDSGGIYEISVLAELTGPGGEDVFAETKRRTVVKVFEVLRHTTQADFEEPFQGAGLSSVENRQYVTTYPDPMEALHPDIFFGAKQDGRVELAGYVDALRQVMSPSTRTNPYRGRQNVRLADGFRFRSDRSMAALQRLWRRRGNLQEKIKEQSAVLDAEYTSHGGNWSKRYSFYNWGAKDSAAVEENIDDPLVAPVSGGGDLMPDGINSSMLRQSALGARFLRFPASRVRGNPGDQGALNRVYRNDTGNLPYYTGGVAFWVKLEFDGSDPSFSGLIGATQVQTDVGPNPDDSEGTQFFVWKNTSGQLRISRIYYHQAFLKGQTGQAIPLISNDDEGGMGDDVELDPSKVWARTDVIVDIGNWRAHEWHHLAVEYNDEVGGNRIRVRIDHEDAEAVSHNLGEEMFCALNVEEPKDGLYVCGFYRDQAVATEGLFKFGTNFDNKMRLTAPSVKRVLANATIDEFVSFEGSYAPPYGAIGYFTDKLATYTNRFLVPIPEGAQRVRLRSLAWTVYPPTSYHGQPVNWNPQQSFLVSVANVGQSGQSQVPLRDAAGGQIENQGIAGRWLYAKGTLQGKVGELVYQVRMKGGTGSGEFGARIVASPVLDDVTLTYYLPSARILLSEKEE